MKDIGIIGCGVMGSAIVRAIAPTLKGKIYLYDIVSEVASNLAQETGGQILPLEALLKESTTIVLAVKPQVLGELYSLLYQAKGKQWISLAAGVSLETLVENLGSEEVIRIMPNIAASVGKSVTAIAPSKGASPLFVEETIALAQTFGFAHLLAESQLNAFIGISASAIATCFEFLHGIALGGVQQGLPYQQSLALIGKTMESAIALINGTHRHPKELQGAVCSPKGTTIESLSVLLNSSLAGLLMESVEAASKRALELELLAKNGDN